MLKIKNTSKKTALKRRDFLSRSVAIGGAAFISAAIPPVHAVKTTTSTSSLFKPLQTYRTVKPGNVTVNDFTNLVGQNFQLRTEDGASISARLIETNLPKTRHGLRFRREHFSIVFDVTADLKLTQGQYILNNPQIDSMVLFMVPVDLPSQHSRLEAVFS